MRMAAFFGERNVDGFLDTLTSDQYREWQWFFQLEPTGWPMVRMVVRRLLWAIFQRGHKETIREPSFDSAAYAMLTPEQEAVRAEMDAERNKAALAAQDVKEQGYRWRK